jgi:hypothetical protein
MSAAAAAPLKAKASDKSGAASGPTRVAAPLLTAAAEPHFGTEDYRITVVSGSQFQAFWSGGLDLGTPWDFATMSRVCLDCVEQGVHFLGNLDIPAGAVIDFIGVNTSTDTEAVMGFSLLFRDHLGGFANLATFSFPAHSFGTDYAGPLGILVPGNKDRSFVLDVEQAASATLQSFGYVEVWWRLAVSDPPATPTFGDVPPSHPFYQFIEAMVSSGITGGCGNGNYCPEAPLTRGQMAVFLAKALGLHWPN